MRAAWSRPLGLFVSVAVYLPDVPESDAFVTRGQASVDELIKWRFDMKKLIKKKAVNSKVAVAVRKAVAVVQPLEERKMLSSIATMETQTNNTAASLDQNPVITAILSQPGTVTPVSGSTRTFTSYNFLVNDGTGSAEVFGYKTNGTTLTYVPAVGDTISVSGTYSLFSGVPEIASVTAISKTGTAAVPAPTVSTIPTVNVNPLPQNIEGYPITLQNVTISGLTGSTFTSTAKGATITDSSSNSMTFFTSVSNSSAYSDLVGQTIPTGPVSITGFMQEFVSGSTTTPEFIPISVGSPIVTSVSPTAGPTGGGNNVTINGYGFTDVTGVKFGNTVATSVTFGTDQQITAVAPAGSVGTVDVTVNNGDGFSATSSNDKYAYTVAPVVTSLSPTAGSTAGGNQVTINGTGSAAPPRSRSPALLPFSLPASSAAPALRSRLTPRPNPPEPLT